MKLLIKSLMVRIYFFIFVSLCLLNLFEVPIEKKLLGSQKWLVTQNLDNSPYRETCHADEENYITYSNSCRLGESNTKVAVFGDSHGVELAYALSRELRPFSIGVSQHTFSGCPPTLRTMWSNRNAACNRWTHHILENLAIDEEIEFVILTFKIQYWIKVERESTAYEEISRPASSLQSLIEISDFLLDSGKKVILVDQVPTLPKSIRDLVFDRNLSLDGDLNFTPVDLASNRVKIEPKFNSEVIYLDPYRFLCKVNKCIAVNDFIPLYFDNNHLSTFGADIVSHEIVGFLTG